MKKLITLLFLLIIMGATNLMAGNPGDTIREEVNVKYYYCELVGVQKAFSTKVVVSIDYGQERKLFEDTRLRDQDGKLVNFNSMVDAMNYLGEQGWEFVQAYIVVFGDTYNYHWILKKSKAVE